MTLKATIQLNPERVIGDVHDYLYGANLEHIGQSIYGGIWAEMLRERKFAGHDLMYLGMNEGLDHLNPNYGIVLPWEGENPDYEKVLYVHDNTTFYTGNQSQRITIRQTDGSQRGIQQKGMVLQTGLGYEIRVVLKGEGQSAIISLGDASHTIDNLSDEWTTYEFTLTPQNGDSNDAFSITIAQDNLWIGCASVMPSDHVEGFRADVIEALKEWGPTFLRWPGGNFVSAYHWQEGIGDRDKRPSYLDPAWSLWESHDVGTDEFLIFCRLVGTDALLTVNMGNGTAEEATAWVEYCNGAPETEFGAMRAANGNPEPYNLRLWFVGNEQFGNWQVGHVDAETYANSYLEFVAKMRAVDPNLELLAVGVPTDLYGHWNELVLKTAANDIDQLSVHYYSIRTEKMDVPPSSERLYLPKIAASHEVAKMLDETLAIMDQFTDHKMPIAFDEWNTYCGAKPPDYIEDYNLADALYTGALMNACIQRADRIKMSAIFNLINVMGSYRVFPEYKWQMPRGGAWVAMGVDEDACLPSVVKVPATLILELMTQHRGEHAIQCKVETPEYTSISVGNLPSFDNVAIIDAAATYDKNSNHVYLSIVNRSVDSSVDIDLEGISSKEVATAFTVTGEHPLSTNSYETPNKIMIQESTISTHEPIHIAAHSFIMLLIELS